MTEDKEIPKKWRAFPATKRVKKSVTGDIELIDLDVTPVMNLFMVLIPFLVSMAVFTHIASIEFSLPPSQIGESTEEESKELDVSIVVTKHGFRIVGTGKKLDIVPTVNGQYQYEKLRVLLKAIKFEYPSQKSVVLVFEGDILYDDIIKFMDICREAQFPDIGLSGDIG
ncbi:MAG: biopolymer transporter ExbD [Chitinispirillaceae bacterium]|nr:biopolymer transporter ExbD [Chitinispirillaceae bacterium]